MWGLIRKDLYSLSSSVKSIVLLMIVFGVIFIPQSGGFAFISVTVFIMASLVISTISLDNAVMWDKYALTLPLSRQDIVKSKYVLLLLLSIIGAVIGLVACAIYETIVNENSLAEMLQMGLLMATMAVAIFSIVLPIIYKYGVEKARMLMVLCIFLPVVVVLSLVYFAENSSVDLAFLDGPLLTVLAMLIAAAAFIVSYFISVRIYSRQDL
ncbi:ABC-2 transporter permease [Candidatus Methanomassiliicoccus intestinalis]|uniref:ABC-2 transporter permease n=1 Tax=Candidatus Methanomassiliicoccus intestinalis TaxID=1406512 RepID=UPI0037DC6940